MGCYATMYEYSVYYCIYMVYYLLCTQVVGA